MDADMIRIALLSVFLSLFSLAAEAAEIEILTPPVVDNAGLKNVAAAFTQATGTQVTIRAMELLKIPQNAATQTADIVFLTPDLMDGLSRSNNVKRGSVTDVGRVNIGLAVRAGTPHPGIGTVGKLIAALKASQGVVYSNPDPARGSLGAIMIDRLLKRPEFAGVHGVISSKGNGASGLINGEGDIALQFESEILPHREIELVGSLPEELGAFVDISAAVLEKSAHPAEAQAFIQYIASRQSAPLWKAGGLSVNH
jgi:molybdate transport system substrate-binding protein